jgi:hypothetical protein
MPCLAIALVAPGGMLWESGAEKEPPTGLASRLAMHLKGVGGAPDESAARCPALRGVSRRAAGCVVRNEAAVGPAHGAVAMAGALASPPLVHESRTPSAYDISG